MTLRPIDIARDAGISTSTLRKYEAFGLLPPVPRSSTGYRQYTPMHAAYVRCARAMIEGFTIVEIASMFASVMQGAYDEAFWLATEALADVQRHRLVAARAAQRLIHRVDKAEDSGAQLTVQQVSEETGIPATTIRHWDRAGLLRAERGPSNRYRYYRWPQVRQILLLYALRVTMSDGKQRHTLAQLREALQQYDVNDARTAAELLSRMTTLLDRMNRARIKGVAALYTLCAQQSEYPSEGKT